MTSHFRPARRQSMQALLPAVSVLVALTACSSQEERAYSLPENLCGAPIAPATLEPLLPGGDKLRQRDDALGDAKWCRLDIDSKSAMSTGATWYNADTKPRRAAMVELGVSPADTPVGDDIIHGRTGAVARVECPAAKEGDVMYVSMRLVDREVEKKDTLAFIRSYAKGIRQTERCAGKQQ